VSASAPEIPAELLLAVAERNGRIALVVGAGCSLEYPTNLKLSSYYSEDVHRQLVHDGILEEGVCTKPADLSVLSSVVYAQEESQKAVVQRLPHNDFRMAPANEGYLAAAALMREGVVGTVLTLNFDLALTDGLGQLSAKEVTVIDGPGVTGQLGSKAIIYLHRNVDESDADRWILRKEALEEEWKDDWQQVVADRVMASPIVVFAGLGSSAEVLTTTVSRIRKCVDAAQHHVYVVDPAAATDFQDALTPPPDEHIQMGWSDFMRRLSNRLVQELRVLLERACKALCDDHGWDDEKAHIASLCDHLHNDGLVPLGKLRAAWLLDEQMYTPDDARRPLIADLLLGVGLVARHTDLTSVFRDNGVIELRGNGRHASSFVAASGGGTLRWSALEAKVLIRLSRLHPIGRPTAALVSGVSGSRPDAIAPPDDLVGDVDDDIVLATSATRMVAVDELRQEPNMAELLVA
jgi:hypothetical protein